MRIASSFAQQETARALHDQDHFSWRAMWLSGLQNALTAGISARLGITNPNLKQIFITNIEKSEEIAFGVQVFLYATRIEKHFDWKAIITAALQPIANTIIQIGVPVIPTNALQQMTQTFVDDAISQEVVNHHIDMEYAAADALGSFTGNLIHYQTMQQYQAWQKDRDQKLYQQWLQQQKQQQQQQRRIEELNEEETKIDAEIKKLDATINSNDNNDNSNNKNPSYQQRQQQHDDTTSRAQRWSQSQSQNSFSLKTTFFESFENLVEMDEKTQEGFEDSMGGRTHDPGNTFFDELGYGVGVGVGVLLQTVTGEELLGGLARGYSALSRFWSPVEAINAGVNKVDDLMNKIEEYMGPGMRIEKPLKGPDLILRSADGTKQIRFDISDPHGDEPHVNIETYVPRNAYSSDGRFIRIENLHAYPQPLLIEENLDESTTTYTVGENWP